MPMLEAYSDDRPSPVVGALGGAVVLAPHEALELARCREVLG